MSGVCGYREIYEEGKKLLADTPEASLDARILLEAACGTVVNDLLMHPDRPVTEEEYARYTGLLEKRRQRIPVAYILGQQEFMGLTMQVSRDVLIPNQDTEILVEEAMRHLGSRMRILDLCTGSGCILLSLLHYSVGTTGIGTDISGAALEVAARNAAALGLSDRCIFLEGDLFGALGSPASDSGNEDGSGLFDMIVSNPPYIPRTVIAALEPEVRVYEPLLALDGGDDGLVFYRRIADACGRYLKPGGLIFVETGDTQTQAVASLLEEAGLKDIEIYQDYGGRPRAVSAAKGLKYV